MKGMRCFERKRLGGDGMGWRRRRPSWHQVGVKGWGGAEGEALWEGGVVERGGMGGDVVEVEEARLVIMAVAQVGHVVCGTGW